MGYRTFDGSDNGGRNTGRTGRPLRNLGLAPTPFDPAREPNPRLVSTTVCRGPGGPDPLGRSEMMWAWGQFLDHELDLVAPGREPIPVEVPDDDPRVEFRSTTMSMVRSKRKKGRLRNAHTPYVDAANVYGTCEDQARFLRGDGGRLHCQLGPRGDVLLPPAEDGLGFVAGDERVNENPVLTSLHTLWLREHNRLCRVLEDEFGIGDDEELYQRARLLVGAQMQVITYDEFLPALLGPEALPPWKKFRRRVKPGISNLFATAGYRLGHTMVGRDLLLEPGADLLLLRDAFFTPVLVHRVGIERFLWGLTQRPMQAIDTTITDGLREHLFKENGRFELRDLAVLNIQRGRDHELPAYGAVRTRFGLAPVATFDELTADADLAELLTEAYGTPDQCDIWVAALAEDPAPPSHLGPVLTAILVDQFTRSRDGDFHWWQHDPALTDDERAWVADRRLADVLRANAGDLGPDRPLHYEDDVFRAEELIEG